jgi:O-antigen ligase
MTGILGLLIALAIIGLVLYAIIALIPMPEVAKNIVIAVGVILMLIVVLRALGVWF